MRFVTLTFTDPITLKVHNLRVNVDEVEYISFNDKKSLIKIKKRGLDIYRQFELYEFTFDLEMHKNILLEAVHKSIDQWDYETIVLCNIYDEQKEVFIRVVHTDDILDDPTDDNGDVRLSFEGFFGAVCLFMNPQNKYEQKCKEWYLRWKSCGM
jgi:hypothetical protein